MSGDRCRCGCGNTEDDVLWSEMLALAALDMRSRSIPKDQWLRELDGIAQAHGGPR